MKNLSQPASRSDISQPYLALLAEDSEAEEILLDHVMSSVPRVKLIGFVRDGIEAMSYLRGGGRFCDRRKFPYPDLVLLDYKMPRMNGMEVLAALSAEGIRLRIIFWTTALGLVDQELARELGASLVCQKPMSSLEMNAIVSQLDRLVPAVQAPIPPLRVVRRTLRTS